MGANEPQVASEINQSFVMGDSKETIVLSWIQACTTKALVSLDPQVPSNITQVFGVPSGQITEKVLCMMVMGSVLSATMLDTMHLGSVP